jgi:hypothetical protein
MKMFCLHTVHIMSLEKFDSIQHVAVVRMSQNCDAETSC